ncbi:hypothetical protein BvCmsNSP015_04210 [Escherichia coli]|nr:hypothetical protein BvCmsNSP015_04210 [Escherichia coli]
MFYGASQSLRGIYFLKAPPLKKPPTQQFWLLRVKVESIFVILVGNSQLSGAPHLNCGTHGAAHEK